MQGHQLQRDLVWEAWQLRGHVLGQAIERAANGLALGKEGGIGFDVELDLDGQDLVVGVEEGWGVDCEGRERQRLRIWGAGQRAVPKQRSSSVAVVR